MLWRNSLIFIILIEFYFVFAVAKETEIYPWEIKCLQSSINLLPASARGKSCQAPKGNKPKCSELTDDLCDALWSKKNLGQMKVGDGVISIGDSPKSDMAMYKLADLRALLDSESRLPPDLQIKAKPILADLKKALDNESSSRAWHRSISLIQARWAAVVEETANDRTEKQYPQLKNIKPKQFTLEQKGFYQEDLNKIKTQILDAKYAKHPNWTRVERVFLQAQEDIIAELRELKIPEDKKQELIKKIATIKMSLPYSDPSLLGAAEDCGATKMNAYYENDHHTFTVCAGYFNGYQSEAAMYGTVAHELSHAIDAMSIATFEERKNSFIVKKLKKTYRCQRTGDEL